MAEETFTAWDLVRTAHVVGLRFGELVATTSLTPTQFAVLVTLADDEGLSSAELARRVLVRPQSANTLVSGLAERGLISRDGPGGRGRRAGLALTGEGRRVLERARPAVRDFNRPESLGLSPARAAMLEELLEQVRAAMESVD